MSMNGRSTGTVPKVKPRANATPRDVEPRYAPVSNMANNLQTAPLDWQSSVGTASSVGSQQSHGRPRKARNTQSRQPQREYHDSAYDLQFPLERVRSGSGDHATSGIQRDLLMETDRVGGFESEARRGTAGDGAHGGGNLRRQDHHTLLDTKNNISRIPDRNQVLSRLNQIRDYVKQTSALMDSLSGSSDPLHLAQAIKLGHMNADLRDSEARLEELLATLNSLAEQVPEVFDTPDHLERFTQLLDIVKTQEDTCLGLFKDGQVIPESLLSPQSSQNGLQNRIRLSSENPGVAPSRSRSTSTGEPGGLPTPAQYAKHQELKLKVEESQKKLQALQEHQAALVALQLKAQQQLHEAQAQQGALMASSVDEHSGEALHTDTINERLDTLNDLLLNRNEVAHLLGEQDEELEAEHSALQMRLQELQGRKQAVDRLVRDLTALGGSPHNLVETPIQQQNGGTGSTRESSEEGDEELPQLRGGDDMAPVSDKIEELNRMKARLAQLQNMMAAVNRGEVPHEQVKAALVSSDLGVRREGSSQQSSKRRPGTSESQKPDNIVLSSETPNYIDAQVLEIQKKTQQLNDAKRQLQQLKDLLGTVGGLAEDGDENAETANSMDQPQQPAPISLESVQALSRELQRQNQILRGSSSQQQGGPKPGPSHQQSSSLPKNKNRQPPEPMREGVSSRQIALQAELRAKRQELEELMRKDQGQSSSVNQDTCSETGFSLPETSATWGGSSSSQTALLATVDQEADSQEQLACSSDDALDDAPVVSSTSQRTAPRPRQQQHVVNQPSSSAQHFQNPWPQFRPKYDTPHKDSSAESGATTPHGAVQWTRLGPSGVQNQDNGHLYDLPGSADSSGATPRPPSEAGSATAPPMPWWPMPQSLDPTNPLYATAQQWPWTPPSSSAEPWWNLQQPLVHPQQLALTLNQCCQMLWMQHRELASLHATVQSLQERVAVAERCGMASAPPIESASSHQPLKVSLSTGVFPMSPADQAAVSGAHSLPNLCEGLPPPPPLPPTTQFPWMPPSAHNQRPPPPSGPPPMLRHGPPVTLNNQVPPGIRANNYWDNFRSYSRQNLLAANKSNEGPAHNPSPIMDRSHNSLRGAELSQGTSSTVNVQPTRPRKQKLNVDERSLSGSGAVRRTQAPESHSRQTFSSPVHTQPRSSGGGPLQEQLYSELAALVAQNKSRPEFLPQLFRELQTLSCDYLCQQALQCIRDISLTARSDRNYEFTTHRRPRSRESHPSFQTEREEGGDLNLAQPLIEENAGSSEASPDSTEGATALPTSTPSSNRQLLPQLPPSVDMQLGAVGCSDAHSGLDVDIQGMLLQLLPFLKAHRDDCCSPALLEAIRQRTLTLVPPPATGLNGFIQGQLDALLEDSLLRFQGCWLRDVGEELLATIAEVLLNELTFFKLLDTVPPRPLAQPLSATPDSSNPTMHGEQQPPTLPETSNTEELSEENSEELGAVGPTPPPRNCWLPSRLGSGGGWEAQAESEAMLGCDGDLAEADQSHEDGREAEGAASSISAVMNNAESLCDVAPADRNSQAEGVVTEDNSSDVAEDEMDNLEGAVSSSVVEGETPTEDEGWHVEQDRELDQVPTRLEPGSGTTASSSSPTPGQPSSTSPPRP